MRMAEVFAEDVAAEERLAAALLFWPTQQMQYEQRCQVVEEVLRQEMEEAVLMLSNAYEKCLQQMRAGELQPPTDGDLEALLSEFAEVGSCGGNGRAGGGAAFWTKRAKGIRFWGWGGAKPAVFSAFDRILPNS